MPQIHSFKLKPDTRVGNYRIVERIGRGWEGEVYKVIEIPTEAPRALKLFSTDKLDEVYSVRYLSHIAWYFEQVRPTGHFPVYHHYGQWFLDDDNGCWYLIFDYIQGSPFKKLITIRSNLKEALFFGLASALANVHVKGFAVGDYDDLSNVFLTKDHRVVFVDCEPGKPDRPNTDFRSDCKELKNAARRIFGKKKPKAVVDFLKAINNHKRFTSATLKTFLHDCTTLNIDSQLDLLRKIKFKKPR